MLIKKTKGIQSNWQGKLLPALLDRDEPLLPGSRADGDAPGGDVTLDKGFFSQLYAAFRDDRADQLTFDEGTVGLNGMMAFNPARRGYVQVLAGNPAQNGRGAVD